MWSPSALFYLHLFDFVLNFSEVQYFLQDFLHNEDFQRWRQSLKTNTGVGCHRGRPGARPDLIKISLNWKLEKKKIQDTNDKHTCVGVTEGQTWPAKDFFGLKVGETNKNSKQWKMTKTQVLGAAWTKILYHGARPFGRIYQYYLTIKVFAGICWLVYLCFCVWVSSSQGRLISSM